MSDHTLQVRVSEKVWSVVVRGFDFHLFTKSLVVLLFVIHPGLDVSNDSEIHLNS